MREYDRQRVMNYGEFKRDREKRNNMHTSFKKSVQKRFVADVSIASIIQKLRSEYSLKKIWRSNVSKFHK